VSLNYTTYEYTVAATQLVLCMLGMGATLTARDFLDIARRPFGVAFVVACQFLLFPLVAAILGATLPVSTGIAIGLILVTAVPSGAVSNILAYSGKGNVPLSITATAASTLTCLFATPLVLRLYAEAHLPADFQIPTGRILLEIVLYLLAPLLLGMGVGYYAPTIKQQFAKWMIRGSLVALAGLVVGSLASGRIDIGQFGWKVPLLIIALGVAKITIVDQVAQRLRFSRDDAFTIAIEVTVRNCNLAILLKASLFPPDSSPEAMGNQVLFTILFYAGAMLVISAVAILLRRRSEPSGTM